MTAIEEEWKPWRAGDYEVSSHGRVRRASRAPGATVGRVLKLATSANGYRAFRASVGGVITNQYVHRAVAESFIGLCPDGYEVNHRDGAKYNNEPSNLEYVTHAANMNHAQAAGLMRSGERHPGIVLTDLAVHAAHALLDAGWSFDDVGAVLGACGATVRLIGSGKGRKVAS